VLRPWLADDGLLVRLRLVGGRLDVSALHALLAVAERYGDGAVHLTGRANLQVRGLPSEDGALPAELLGAVESTGLVPSRTHELVRNIMVSPATGVAGGRADLRAVAAELDRRLCGSPRLSVLPGRFLFILDDGRGDVLDRPCDLGLVALDDETAQLRVGGGYAAVVSLDDAAATLVDLAERFVDVRTGDRGQPGQPGQPDHPQPDDDSRAAWHVNELDGPLTPLTSPDPRVPEVGGPLAYGPVLGGHHVEVPEARLNRRGVEALPAEGVDEVVVTPWRGIFVPEVRRP
jgi:precorrin-3B synthase